MTIGCGVYVLPRSFFFFFFLFTLHSSLFLSTFHALLSAHNHNCYTFDSKAMAGLLRLGGYTKKGPLPHTVKNTSGYIDNAFPGKEEQMIKVTEYLSEKAFIPAALAQNEVSWFYG